MPSKAAVLGLRFSWPGQTPIQTHQNDRSDSQGPFCSTELVASYADFPRNGNWTLRATIDGTKLGVQMNWILLPRKFIAPHHNQIGKTKPTFPSGGTYRRINRKQEQNVSANHLKLPGGKIKR
jgi:hypothetical protein